MIICMWSIKEWELQIWSWSSPVQPENATLFTISFQCLNFFFFKSQQVFDWLAKWLIMSESMDLRRPRVCRHSNVGLVAFCFVGVKLLVQKRFMLVIYPYSSGLFKYCKVSNISRTLVGNKLVESLRCSWSIACRHCSNYIFMIDLTPGCKWLGKDNGNMRQESFQLWDYVRLILKSLW